MLIHDAARAIATVRWFEEELFRRTGAWAAEGGDAEVTRVLATLSRHHGWRAAQWANLQPMLHDLDPAELAPSTDDVALLAGLDAETDRTRRLVELTRVVLPALLERYDALGAPATEADAPMARMLRLVTLDARADQAAAEEVVQRTTS